MAAEVTSSRVVMRPGVRSGQPIIAGTRITVWDILGWLAAGATESQILEDYPDLTHDDLLAALQFAYDLKDKFPLETAV
ncbi:MAG: DUF433 domain-containing protein [Bryobacteraceae bacterium]